MDGPPAIAERIALLGEGAVGRPRGTLPHPGRRHVRHVGLPADVVTALRGAGDRLLHALIFRSDHLELSEQFDAFSGYEKSVTNLSWSYAAFLSAVLARKAI